VLVTKEFWERVSVAVAPALFTLLGVGLTLWHSRLVARESRREAREQDELRHERAEALRLRQERQRVYVQFLADTHDLAAAHFKVSTEKASADLGGVFEKAAFSGFAVRLLAPADTSACINPYLNALNAMLNKPGDPDLENRSRIARTLLVSRMRRDLGVADDAQDEVATAQRKSLPSAADNLD
jgi:hypothetical protein